MKPMAGSERSGAGSPGTGANASSKVMAPTRSTASGGATGGTAARGRAGQADGGRIGQADGALGVGVLGDLDRGVRLLRSVGVLVDDLEGVGDAVIPLDRVDVVVGTAS